MPETITDLIPQFVRLQSDLTAEWHSSEPHAAGTNLTDLVRQNHYFNFMLWHEEDIARRDDLGFERIAQAKRAIDRYNQLRNNFIEEMDKALIHLLMPALSGCPKNSETPGMMLDRLSILALKEFHMREETQRSDATASHVENCQTKLVRIVKQRGDLADCLSELIDDVLAQRRTFAVYYQFKMYNDPALNPQLYGASEKS
ncbi:MAG: DUF4254 domain-containing protein [Verrucomicrobia bacterium]|nr:MAG: DUF4254 domain-containing protein [Verrucomicrobiota bacterium]